MSALPQSRRRTVGRLVKAAIDSGRHRIELRTDGTVVILPTAPGALQGDGDALDAEIRELIGDGEDGR